MDKKGNFKISVQEKSGEIPSNGIFKLEAWAVEDPNFLRNFPGFDSSSDPPTNFLYSIRVGSWEGKEGGFGYLAVLEKSEAEKSKRKKKKKKIHLKFFYFKKKNFFFFY